MRACLDDDLDLLGAEPAPMYLVGDDSWLTLHTPGDYTNAVTQLKASADNLNLTAQEEPGWSPIYANAQRLFTLYNDVGFFSSINPFGGRTLNNASWNAIADAQRRIDEFAEEMRRRGKTVVEPKHKPIDDRAFGNAPEELRKYLPWVLGGVVVLGLGWLSMPLIIPLIARGFHER